MELRRKPLIRVGHRGAPRVAPANTMASFRAAHLAGCDWVECDCRPSLDGVIVLSHDDTVTDITGRAYRIEEHTADDLAVLDLGQGEGVPTLEELVAWAAGRVSVMADVKCSGFEREIGEGLCPLPRAAKVVPGADEEGRRHFRELFPDLPLSWSVGVDAEDALVRRWDALDTEALTLEYPLVTPARLESAHRRGITVFAWTVDDLETMRALTAMGIDGLISNRADRLMMI